MSPLDTLLEQVHTVASVSSIHTLSTDRTDLKLNLKPVCEVVIRDLKTHFINDLSQKWNLIIKYQRISGNMDGIIEEYNDLMMWNQIK